MIDELFKKIFLERYFPSEENEPRKEEISKQSFKKKRKEMLKHWKRQLSILNNQ